MYSTLIVLDKPRHLRYTFSSVSDLDQAIPGGFYNLFKFSAKGEVGFRILRDMLYAGLKWEDTDLTIPDMGLILLYFSGDDPGVLLWLWKKVFETLDYDKWTSNQKDKPKNEKQSDGENEPKTISEMLEEIEKVAYSTVGLQPNELYALTPREFSLILDNYGELENRRAGMICATIMNSVGGKKSGEPFKISDFISDSKEPQIMSDEEIKRALQGAFGGI